MLQETAAHEAGALFSYPTERDLHLKDDLAHLGPRDSGLDFSLGAAPTLLGAAPTLLTTEGQAQGVQHRKEDWV